MSDAPLSLRAQAESLAAPFPPLLAQARELAATVQMGLHGRRRAGPGETFWQYRRAEAHDSARAIDWRRSARSDTPFVQDREWQLAQSVLLWVDTAASMQFASSPALPSKADRARVIALAAAVLLSRAGERVGLGAPALPPRHGAQQVSLIAEALAQSGAEDYGAPGTAGLPPQSRALFVSDFLGEIAPVEAAVAEAADRNIRGVLLQVLDPEEEGFGFAGRTIFRSMAGALRHDTLDARGLRERYLERLAERKDRLAQIARSAGWQVETHHTSDSAATALLWLYTVLHPPLR